MNKSLMFTDHADKDAKLTAKPGTAAFKEWHQVSPLITIAAILALVVVAAHFAIQLSEQRALTAEILRLTEQSIKLAEESCDTQEVSGIRMRFCVKAVGQ